MKFLADINLPQTVIQKLQSLGHDVLDIKQESLTLKDREIIEIAKTQKRIILTRDKDFIALTQFPKHQVPTIVIRLKDQRPEQILTRLSELLANQDENILNTSLTLLKEDSADSHPF